MLSERQILRAALVLSVVVAGATGCERPLLNAACPCLEPQYTCCSASDTCVLAGTSCSMPGGDGATDSAGDVASDGARDSSVADQMSSAIDVRSDDTAPPDGGEGGADAPLPQADGAAGHGAGGSSGGGGAGGVGSGGSGVGSGGSGVGSGGSGVGSGGSGVGGMTTGAGILAGRVTIKTDTVVLFATPVPGAAVTLEGPERRQAITDANGSYRFERLSPGTYTVRAWKPGVAAGAGADQQLTPSPVDSNRVVDATGPGVVQNFTCASPCQAAAGQPLLREVDPARELVIQDSTVLEDARADNAVGGPWSFRHLLEKMAWDTTANVLAESWLTNMSRSGRDVTALRGAWPTIEEAGQVVPDLARAPFRLLAIVNRLDLRAVGNGEIRFIYGIYPVEGAPSFNLQGAAFTVSIDFHLPTTANLPDRQTWARRFHDLGDLPFDATGRYNSALQILTDVVLARSGIFSPGNPSGSNLAAFRVNERFRVSTDPAQLRQFRLQADPSSGRIALTLGLLPQTPDWAQVGTDGPVSQLLNQQAALVQTGFVVLPDALLASVAPAASTPPRWSFPSIAAEPLRQAFAGQTCMGCHWSEFPTHPSTTFHVDPSSSSGAAGYFVNQVDLPRRIAFLRNQLTCSPATCAVGGIEMMAPAP